MGDRRTCGQVGRHVGEQVDLWADLWAGRRTCSLASEHVAGKRTYGRTCMRICGRAVGLVGRQAVM